MRYIKILSALILMSFAIDAAGQIGYQKHFDTSNGLPADVVYKVFKDHLGFLWICTDRGIAKYNGITFKYFTTAEGLPDNMIFNIVEDKYHRLWVHSFNGSLCYIQNDSVFTAKNKTILKLDFEKSPVQNMALEADGSVTIFFRDRRYFVNILKDATQTIEIDLPSYPDLDFSRLFQIRKESSNSYTLFFSNYIAQLNSKTGFIENKRNYRSANSYFFNVAIGKNEHFLLSADGVHDFTDERKLYQIGPILGNTHTALLALDAQSILWANDSSLYLNDNQIFGRQFITSIEQDLAGKIWISTKGAGVFCLQLGTGHFKFNAANKHVERDYVSRWILDVDYRKSVSLFQLLQNNFLNGYSNHIAEGNRIVYKQKLYEFDKGSVQVSDLSGNKKKATIPIEPINERVKNLYWRNDTILGVGNYNIIQCPIDNPSKSSILVNALDLKGRIFARAIDSQGMLWFSSSSSIYKMDKGTYLKQKQFADESFKRMGFAGGKMVGITFENELKIYEGYDTERVTQYTIKHNRFIWDQLYKIDDDNLLIRTNSYYNILSFPVGADNKKARLITIENELIPESFDALVVHHDSLYFFDKHEVTVVSRAMLFKQAVAPLIFNPLVKTAGNHSIPVINNRIELGYKESLNLKIQFSCISPDSKEVIFEYKKSDGAGLSEWTETEQTEFYPELDGFGEQHVYIRAKTISSDYAQEVHLHFFVARPYWATWWFWSIILIIIASIVASGAYLIFRRRFEKQKEKVQSELKVQQAEFKALNALMNPHFIFNSLNNIQGLITNGDSRLANTYLQRFANLIRQNISAVNKGLISLEQELAIVNSYVELETLSRSRKISFETIVAIGVDVEEIFIPPLILQPLVENAIKHGLNTLVSNLFQIKIDVYAKLDTIVIDIKNNGTRLSQKDPGSNNLSMALENMQARIKHINAFHDTLYMTFELTEIVDAHQQLWILSRVTINML